MPSGANKRLPDKAGLSGHAVNTSLYARRFHPAAVCWHKYFPAKHTTSYSFSSLPTSASLLRSAVLFA